MSALLITEDEARESERLAPDAENDGGPAPGGGFDLLDAAGRYAAAVGTFGASEANRFIQQEDAAEGLITDIRGGAAGAYEQTARNLRSVARLAPRFGEFLFDYDSALERARREPTTLQGIIDAPAKEGDWFEEATSRAAYAFGEGRREYTVDPATRSEAANIVGGVARGLTSAVAGAALGGPAGPVTGPVAFGGVTARDEYDRLIEAGVDPETARRAANITQAWMSAMGFAPVALPGRIITRAATGAGFNVGLGAGERINMDAYLRGQGYDEVADRYQWLDPQAMAIDAILGATFGAAFGGRGTPRTRAETTQAQEPPRLETLTPDQWLDRARQFGNEGDVNEAYAHALVAKDMGNTEADGVLALLDEEPGLDLNIAEMRANELSAELARRAIASDPDLSAAAMVEADAIQRDIRSAPGIPADPAAARVHSNALRRVEEQAFNDETIDATGMGVEDARFIPHPEGEDLTIGIESMAQTLDEAGFAEQAAELRRARDAGFAPDDDGLMFSRGADVSRARSEGYRGSDTGEAVEWLRARAKGLDMSTEARMQRARAMGFNVDAPLYRGMTRPAEGVAFTPTRSGGYMEQGPGVSTSPEPYIAQKYANAAPGPAEEGATIYPVFARGRYVTAERFYDTLDRIAKKRGISTAQAGIEAQSQLRSKGFSGFRYANDEIRIWPDADGKVRNVRSVNAAFDPDFADSDNLLASRGARGARGGGASPEAIKQALIDSFGRDAQRLLNTAKTEIVATTGELSRITGRPIPADAKGAYDPRTGKSYIVAENVSPDEAARILLHEVGVHTGMKTMLGDKLYAQLGREVEALIAAGNPIAKAARERVDALVKAGDMKAADAPEETIAYLVETAPDLPFVRRLLAQIRQWLWRTFDGAEWIGRLTVEDIRQLAVTSLRREARTKERARAGGELMFGDGTGRELDRMGFASIALEAAKKLPDRAMRGEEALNRIAKARGVAGFTGRVADEMKFLGLDEFRSRKSVTKEELLYHIRANRLALNEAFNRLDPNASPVRDVDTTGWTATLAKRNLIGPSAWIVRNQYGQRQIFAQSAEEAIAIAAQEDAHLLGNRQRLDRAGIRRGHGDLRLPGDEPVFELRLKIPEFSAEIQARRDAIRAELGQSKEFGPGLSESAIDYLVDNANGPQADAIVGDRPQAKALLDELRQIEARRVPGSDFESHWSRPPSNDLGVLVSVRGEERIDDKGQRTLFGGEVQSDLAQSARALKDRIDEARAAVSRREKDFAEAGGQHTPEEKAAIRAAEKKANDALASNLRDEPGERSSYDVANDELIALRKAQGWFGERGRALTALNEARSHLDALEKQGGAQLDAPLASKTSAWTGAAVRAIIYRAARDGFDSVSFPTGETSKLIQGNDSAASHYDTNVLGAVKKVAQAFGGKVRDGSVAVTSGQNRMGRGSSVGISLDAFTPEKAFDGTPEGDELFSWWNDNVTAVDPRPMREIEDASTDLSTRRVLADIRKLIKNKNDIPEAFRAEVLEGLRKAEASVKSRLSDQASAYVLDLTPQMKERILKEGMPLFSRSFDDLERLLGDTRIRTLKEPPANAPEIGTPEWDAALAEVQRKTQTGERLTPMDRWILAASKEPQAPLVLAMQRAKALVDEVTDENIVDQTRELVDSVAQIKRAYGEFTKAETDNMRRAALSEVADTIGNMAEDAEGVARRIETLTDPKKRRQNFEVLAQSVRQAWRLGKFDERIGDEGPKLSRGDPSAVFGSADLDSRVKHNFVRPRDVSALHGETALVILPDGRIAELHGVNGGEDFSAHADLWDAAREEGVDPEVWARLTWFGGSRNSIGLDAPGSGWTRRQRAAAAELINRLDPDTEIMVTRDKADGIGSDIARTKRDALRLINEETDDLQFSIGKRDSDPVKQAIVDEPDLRIPDALGRDTTAVDALAQADDAIKVAREMQSGFKAAASCAAQHGIDPIMRASTTIAAGHGLGGALGIPAGYTAAMFATADERSRREPEYRREQGRAAVRGLSNDERFPVVESAGPVSFPASGRLPDDVEEQVGYDVNPATGRPLNAPADAPNIGGPEEEY